jgi:hypothetical protein
MDIPINHHVVPRLYLTGFSSDSQGKYIFQYTLGQSYVPSISQPGFRSNSSPAHLSIKSQAGIIPGIYSFTSLNGTHDIAGIEPKLARLERYSDRILQILQGRPNPINKFALNPLTRYQKATFAVYINLMINRTPLAKIRGEETWAPSKGGKKAFNNTQLFVIQWAKYIKENAYTESDQYIKVIRDFTLSRASSGRNYYMSSNDLMLSRLEASGTVKDFLLYSEFITREDLPDFAYTFFVANNSHFHAKWLRKMRWTYLVAPPGSHVVTCDNPVALVNKIPVWSSKTELTLPITSRLALLCSWHYDLPEGYVVATPAVVAEVNHRTIFNASQWVFASEDRKSIADAIESRSGAQQWIYDMLTEHS